MSPNIYIIQMLLGFEVFSWYILISFLISFGIWCLMLKQLIPTVSRLTISRMGKSSTNLNLSSGLTQSALLLDWDKYSKIPNVAPWGPPPFILLGEVVKPLHLTDWYLSWKYDMSRGIIVLLTPFFWNEIIPYLGHCLTKAEFQSIIFAITANVCLLELLSRAVCILCIILIK